MHTPEQIAEAKEDFRKKVFSLLDSVHENAKNQTIKYLEEHTGAIDLHIEHGMIYDIPKDFLVALMEDAAWGYGPLGCTTSTIRRTKKNVRNFRRHIYR